MKFARLKNSTVVPAHSENNPLSIPVELQEQVFEPRGPRELLHGLMDIIARCGNTLNSAEVVCAVIQEVDRWQILEQVGAGREPQNHNV